MVEILAGAKLQKFNHSVINKYSKAVLSILDFEIPYLAIRWFTIFYLNK